MIFQVLTKFIALFALVFITSCVATPSDGPQGANEAQANSSASPKFETITSAENYVLGQGDKISILVFDEPDLSIKSTVSASGIINYSYLGDIQVSGKTPFELEKHIATLLENGYLVNPSVNVSIEEFRPFFIGGEVRSPGSYPYQPGLTLDKAIAIGGGLTDRASLRRAFVSREGAVLTTPEKISLGDPVRPGDTITIQEGFF